MKTYVHTKLSMGMLIVALFIIGEKKKKLAPTQVSTSCWVNKQPWGTHLGEYHSAEKEHSVDTLSNVDESHRQYAERKKLAPEALECSVSCFLIWVLVPRAGSLWKKKRYWVEQFWCVHLCTVVRLPLKSRREKNSGSSERKMWRQSSSCPDPSPPGLLHGAHQTRMPIHICIYSWNILEGPAST